jgi:hypothetical protein
MYLRFPSLIVKTGASASGYDADAQAYFTGASITSTPEKDAYNTFVTTLKSDGIYSKLKTFHPFLGSTTTTKAYNAINTSLSSLSYTGGTSTAGGLLFNNNQAQFTVSGLNFADFGTGLYVRNIINLVDEDFRMLLETQNGIQIAQGKNFVGAYYLESGFNSNSFLIESESSFCTLAIQSTVESSTPYTRFYSNEPVEVISGVANSSVSSPVYFGDTYGIVKDIEIGCVYTSEGLTAAQSNTLHSRISTLMVTLGRN